ncbi:splicing factor, Prp19-binding domain-containing protein [Halteromyces radiatus]|uniref:splicing factor, Prp19-binding domain-containing protein n=1 Tax=Halteromyces radiatus TaxID=101107 RepID=UPI00221EBCA7|nr:splicing factor, Prp19-binding domain-containing protein [Halteromyces radiatus]KAI8078747.1 splicing factor, Prp19-binding domain-containing protein [Halteromyces radiatus]
MSYRPQQRQKGPAAPVKRYRAGVPKGYVEESSESDEEEEQQQQQQQQQPSEKPVVQFAQKDVVTGIQQVHISEKDAQSDRRLRRLQQVQQQQQQQQPGIRRRRMVEEEEEEEEEESDQEDNVDEDQQAKHRALMKQKALQRVQDEQQFSTKVEISEEEASEEESEESSEYETDSEEGDTLQRMPKPMFVPRNHRATILEQERLQREAEEREQRLADELEERRQQSHNLLAEELKRENEKAAESDVEDDVDDTDGLDEEAEFEAWKIRELMRVKRDREERIAREKEEEELERRRALPEEVRLKEDMERANETRNKEKGEFTYMQKYYHKGAFYRDEEDEIFKRDYSAPTINEVRKKDLLPKVMQVKNFGLAGRTKYTHLADQDTTDKDSPWNQQPLPKRRKHGFDDRK